MKRERKITTSSLRDLSSAYEWKETDRDPFSVEPQVSWWRSFPIFVLTFPVTLLSLMLVGCISVVFVHAEA